MMATASEETLKMGLRLREFRKEVIKKSQVELAKDLNMIQKSISNYENGLVYPDRRFFEKLKASYGANPIWLQTGAGSRQITNNNTSRINQDTVRILEAKIDHLEKRLQFMESQTIKLVEILEIISGKING